MLINRIHKRNENSHGESIMCCVYDIGLPSPHPPRHHAPRSQIHTGLVIPHLPVPTLIFTNVHLYRLSKHNRQYDLLHEIYVSFPCPSTFLTGSIKTDFFSTVLLIVPRWDRSWNPIDSSPSTWKTFSETEYKCVCLWVKRAPKQDTWRRWRSVKTSLYVVLSPVSDTVVKHDCEVCVGNSLYRIMDSMMVYILSDNRTRTRGLSWSGGRKVEFIGVKKDVSPFCMS